MWTLLFHSVKQKHWKHVWSVSMHVPLFFLFLIFLGDQMNSRAQHRNRGKRYFITKKRIKVMEQINVCIHNIPVSVSIQKKKIKPTNQTKNQKNQSVNPPDVLCGVHFHLDQRTVAVHRGGPSWRSTVAPDWWWKHRFSINHDVSDWPPGSADRRLRPPV